MSHCWLREESTRCTRLRGFCLSIGTGIYIFVGILSSSVATFPEKLHVGSAAAPKLEHIVQSLGRS